MCEYFLEQDMKKLYKIENGRAFFYVQKERNGWYESTLSPTTLLNPRPSIWAFKPISEEEATLMVLDYDD